MKKIIIVTIFIFLSFIGNVKANLNSGQLYEEYWQASKVNVFASDTTTDRMDYNGWYMRSTTDNDIYYCIEPESYMGSINETGMQTHKIYSSEEEIINHSRLTKETMDRVKLLAYYGYNYQNHTDKKWYGITQVMIWKLLRPDITWKYKESRYGAAIDNLYQNEEQELNNLVNSHNLLPSFNNESIVLVKGKSITLTDTNNVLKDYLIKDTPNASFTISGNTLTITAKSSGNLVIDLEKEQVNNSFSLFTSNTYQDLITRGNVSFNKGSLNINILEKEIYGSIKLHKLKGGSGEEYHDEKDASFEIKSAGNLIATITTDENGIALLDNIPYGKYTITQITGSDGYNFVSDILVSVTEEKEYFYELKNIKKSKVILYKKDQKSNRLLSGAKFNLYDINDNLIESNITNQDGYIEFSNLTIGKYYLQEITPPNYYLLNDEKIYFEVPSDGQIIYLSHLNTKDKGSLEIIKIDGDLKIPLKGAIIAIYDKDTNEKIFELETNDEGKIYLFDIDQGSYYIKEIKPPTNYQLSSTNLSFEIKDHNPITITLENYKITNPYTKDNIKSYIIIFGITSFSIISTLAVKYKKRSKHAII